jgi:drug/metabolite transporter (DMT)-like permease
VLVDSIWHRRLPTMHIMIALGLTIVGIILLTGLWSLSLNGLDGIGLLFAVLSVVTFIGYLLLGRRVGRDLPPLAGTSFGALVAGVFWLFVQPPWSIPANTWEPSRLLLIAIVGIAGMAIPFSLELAALRRIDAPRVGIAAMLELVAAGVIAYFWLAQYLNISQILGGLLVIAGIAILQIE